MNRDDNTFPTLLVELHDLEFDYDDGDGMDFEPYSEFLSREETDHWIRAWTGNDTLDGSCYRIFGQDGTGGYAAFWCVRPGRGLLEQPVVFFGSEGELGIVATDFSDYLWLLAGGFGPYEAVEYPDGVREADPGFTAFANEHAKFPQRTPAEVLARAHADFPRFKEEVLAVCR